MDIDRSAESRLDRITSLLAGLPGPLGNGKMLVWVENADRDAMPQAVFDHLHAAGLLERWYPRSQSTFPRQRRR